MKDKTPPELSMLSSGLLTLRRRMEQLSVLHEEEREAPARIARLERVLDFDRVAAHATDALALATLTSDPVPHFFVRNLLPSEAYDALIEAIPSPMFFEGRIESRQEMRSPPRLAPMASIVAWMFLNDVGRLLSDILVARLAEPLAAYVGARFPWLPPFRQWGVDVTLTEARLVRRAPGFTGRAPAGRAWDLMTGVLQLARPKDGEAYGSRLQTVAFPFQANSLLLWVGTPEALVLAPIPASAPGEVERYTYEFGIGPTRAGRRAIAAMAAESADGVGVRDRRGKGGGEDITPLG
jgi:hypothetical protein